MNFKRILVLVMIFAMLMSTFSPALGVFADYINEGAHTHSQSGESKDKHYVSIGDSMANGYGFDGYQQGNDGVNIINNQDKFYGAGAYPLQFEEYLKKQGYDVTHTKLASSALRAEDLLYLLGGRDTPADDWYEQVNNYTGIDNNDVLKAFYQDAVKDADIITLGIGNASFGAFFLSRVTSMLGVMGGSLTEQQKAQYTLENALKLLDNEEEKEIIRGISKKISETMNSFVSEEYAEKYHIDEVSELLSYTAAGFIINFSRSVDKIVELNPDAEIILVGLMNTTYGMTIDLENGEKFYFGDLMDQVFALLNDYIVLYPTLKQAEGKLQGATFHYAEQPQPKFIVQAFDDLAYAGWTNIDCGDDDCGTEGHDCEGEGRLSADIVRARTITSYNNSLREMISAGFVAGINAGIEASVMQGWQENFGVAGMDSASFMELLKQHGHYDTYQADLASRLLTDYYGFLPRITLADVKAYQANVPTAWNNQYFFMDARDVKNLAVAVYLGIEDAIVNSIVVEDIPLSGLMTIAGDLTSVFDGFAPSTDSPEAVHNDLTNFFSSEDILPLVKIYAIFKIGDGMCVHPTPAGHDDLFEVVVESYNEKDGIPADVVLGKMHHLYVTASDMGVLGEMPEMALLEELYETLDAHNHITDKQTLNIILAAYTRLLDKKLSDKDTTEIAQYAYETLVRNPLLTYKERIEIVGEIYEVLKSNNYFAEYQALELVEELYKVLDEKNLISDEQSYVIVDRVYEAIIDGVLTNAEQGDLVKFIYNTLAGDESISDADQVAVVTTVYAVLKAHGYYLEAELTAVLEELCEELTSKNLLSDEQAAAIIDCVYEAILDGVLTSDEQNNLVKFIYNTLAGDKSISDDDQVAVLSTVYSVLKRNGYIALYLDAKAVETAETIYRELKAANLLSDKKTADIADYVFNAVIDGELTSKELLDIIVYAYRVVVVVENEVPARQMRARATDSNNTASSAKTIKIILGIVAVNYLSEENQASLETLVTGENALINDELLVKIVENVVNDVENNESADNSELLTKVSETVVKTVAEDPNTDIETKVEITKEVAKVVENNSGTEDAPVIDNATTVDTIKQIVAAASKDNLDEKTQASINKLLLDENALISDALLLKIVENAYNEFANSDVNDLETLIENISKTIVKTVVEDPDTDEATKIAIANEVFNAFGNSGILGDQGSDAYFEVRHLAGKIYRNLEAKGLLGETELRLIVTAVAAPLLYQEKLSTADVANILVELNEIVFGRDDLSFEQKIEIFVVVYETLYEEGYITEENAQLVLDFVLEYYDDAYAYGYDYIDKAGYIDVAVSVLEKVLARLELVDLSDNGPMTEEFRALLQKEIDALEIAIAKLIVVLDTDALKDVDGLVRVLNASVDDILEHLANIYDICAQAGIDVNQLVILPALEEALRILETEVLPELDRLISEFVDAVVAHVTEKAEVLYNAALGITKEAYLKLVEILVKVQLHVGEKSEVIIEVLVKHYALLVDVLVEVYGDLGVALNKAIEIMSVLVDKTLELANDVEELISFVVVVYPVLLEQLYEALGDIDTALDVADKVMSYIIYRVSNMITDVNDIAGLVNDILTITYEILVDAGVPVEEAMELAAIVCGKAFELLSETIGDKVLEIANGMLDKALELLLNSGLTYREAILISVSAFTTVVTAIVRHFDDIDEALDFTKAALQTVYDYLVENRVEITEALKIVVDATKTVVNAIIYGVENADDVIKAAEELLKTVYGLALEAGVAVEEALGYIVEIANDTLATIYNALVEAGMTLQEALELAKAMFETVYNFALEVGMTVEEALDFAKVVFETAYNFALEAGMTVEETLAFVYEVVKSVYEFALEAGMTVEEALEFTKYVFEAVYNFALETGMTLQEALEFVMLVYNAVYELALKTGLTIEEAFAFVKVVFETLYELAVKSGLTVEEALEFTKALLKTIVENANEIKENLKLIVDTYYVLLEELYKALGDMDAALDAANKVMSYVIYRVSDVVMDVNDIAILLNDIVTITYEILVDAGVPVEEAMELAATIAGEVLEAHLEKVGGLENVLEAVDGMLDSALNALLDSGLTYKQALVIATGAFTTVVTVIVTYFDDIDEALDFTKAALQTVYDFLVENRVEITEALKIVVDATKTVVNAIIYGVENADDAIKAAEELLKTVCELALEAGVAVEEALKIASELLNDVIKLVVEKAEDINAALQHTVELFKTVYNFLVEAGVDVEEALKITVEVLKEVIKFVVENAEDINEALQYTVELFKTIYNFLVEAGVDVEEALKITVEVLKEAVKFIVENAEDIKAALEIAGEVFKTVYNFLVENGVEIQHAIKIAVEVVKEIVEFVIENAEDIENAFEIAKDVFATIYNFLVENGEDIQAALEIAIEVFTELVEFIIAHTDDIETAIKYAIEAYEFVLEAAKLVCNTVEDIYNLAAKAYAKLVEVALKIHNVVDVTIDVYNFVYELLVDIFGSVENAGKVALKIATLIVEYLKNSTDVFDNLYKVYIEIYNLIVEVYGETGDVCQTAEAIYRYLVGVLVAIKEDIADLIYDASNGNYVITENSFYLALGNAPYASELAEMLFLAGKYAQLGLADDYLEALEKADLVTVKFNNGEVLAFAYTQVMGTLAGIIKEHESLKSIYETLESFGLLEQVEETLGFTLDAEAVELNWSKYVDAETEQIIKNTLARIKRDLIAGGTPEYVDITPMLNGVIKQFLPVNLTDEVNIEVAELVVFAIESALYAYVEAANRVLTTVEVIKEVAPNATVVITGLNNPLLALVPMLGAYVDLTEYVGYVDVAVDAFNAQLYAVALTNENVIFVETENAEDIYEALHARCAHAYDDCEDAVCNICGETRVAPGHKYDDCEDTTCNVCGATRVAPGHKYDDCADTTCNVCGATRVAPGHVYDDCEDATCNVCGAIRVAPGHDWDEGVVTKEPTRKEEGEKLLTCKVCGKTKTCPIPFDGMPLPLIIAIIVGSLVVVCGAGAFVYYYYFDKKRRA